MRTIKNILIVIGVAAILLSIIFLIVGFKVVSTVVVYTIGTIAVIALIGFVVYYLRKLFSRNNSQ